MPLVLESCNFTLQVSLVDGEGSFLCTAALSSAPTLSTALVHGRACVCVRACVQRVRVCACSLCVRSVCVRAQRVGTCVYVHACATSPACTVLSGPHGALTGLLRVTGAAGRRRRQHRPDGACPTSSFGHPFAASQWPVWSGSGRHFGKGRLIPGRDEACVLGKVSSGAKAGVQGARGLGRREARGSAATQPQVRVLPVSTGM